jgi:hypothetical protein
MSFSDSAPEVSQNTGHVKNGKCAQFFVSLKGFIPNSKVQLGSKPRRFAAKGTRAVYASLMRKQPRAR